MRPTLEALTRPLRYTKYRLLGYSSSPPSAEDWDREYGAAAWQRLGGLSELAHYSIILGYSRFLQAKSILDVCCGEGVLTGMLQAIHYDVYHGVDISSHAIAAAEARHGNDGTQFFHAEAEAFRPVRCFDTIIFNECLYYFEKPQALIRRYLEFLEPGGRMIVSIWVSGQERALFRLIEKEVTLLDTTTVANRDGQRWIVKVFGERCRTAPLT
jgi:2-polyprenyl-3-methyl-5-hydroxy-6-metoxy-1,4-benzoquinol methylase